MAEFVVQFLGIYAGLGALFALAFVTIGCSRLDPEAQGAPIQFRLIIIPASLALWPWLAWKWVRPR